MYFDWFTWTFWSLGVVVFITWLVMTIKEYHMLVKERKSKNNGI